MLHDVAYYRDMRIEQLTKGDNMKRYWVFYIGTGNGRAIYSTGPTAARRAFAIAEGVKLSAYIGWSRTIPAGR